MEGALSHISKAFPGRACGLPYFCEEAAHQLLAAADFLLLPSRFEPCGLVAMHGLRYGAVPITTLVGGFKDIVSPEACPCPFSQMLKATEEQCAYLLATIRCMQNH